MAGESTQPFLTGTASKKLHSLRNSRILALKAINIPGSGKP
jgi:hypothetical protein